MIEQLGSWISGLPEGLDLTAMHPVLLVLLVAAATFISEDLTCIGAGLLVARGEISPGVGVAGCLTGIWIGDLGLWVIGSLFAGGIGRRFGFARSLEQRSHAVHDWFDRHGPKALLLARFIPGTRVPVYFTAGLLRLGFVRFALWTLLAVGIWSPLLVLLTAQFGEAFIAPFEQFLGGGWIAVAVAAVVLYLLFHIVLLSLTSLGRAKLRAMVSRVWRWEFWPMWLFYLPLLPVIALLALRHRGFMTISAANPAIYLGGIVGERKRDILRLIGPGLTPPWIVLEPGDVEMRRARLCEALELGVISLPLILKPDIGQRGEGLRYADTLEKAEAALEEIPEALIVQNYDPGPHEAGIFYYRYPDEPRGRIFSITHKVFPEVIGDGRSTLEELICRHPRFAMQSAVFLARHGDHALAVPAEGERVRLARAGNHCQGTMFLDGAHLITPALEERIDAIARGIDGFYFGRFDIRYADEREFLAGRGLTIIEINGAMSESTNIYDPSRSLRQAYATLIAQWRILFRIGRQNRQRGVPVATWRMLTAELSSFYRHHRPPRLAD